MIPVPSDARIWIALGHTDMRRGMRGLALLVQESLKRDLSAAKISVIGSMLNQRSVPKFLSLDFQARPVVPVGGLCSHLS